MVYAVGVDGGQTSTRAVLVNEFGNVIGRGTGGPANHIHEPGGQDRVRTSVRTAIVHALEQAGLPPDHGLDSVWLGMTGGGPEMEAICQSAITARAVTLSHDTIIAHFAVTLGGPGVVVIGGTGSVGFGVDHWGRSLRVGGWGYLMGDEGSAWWVAVEALKECCKMADDMRNCPVLMDHVLRAAGVDDMLALHARVYSSDMGRHEIAALAPAVSAAAAAGDQVAQGVLRTAARELGWLAVRVLNRLKLSGGRPVVGYTGGMFTPGNGVLDTFKLAVRRLTPEAHFCPPQLLPEGAAAGLALRHAGIPLSDDVLANLIAGLPAESGHGPGILDSGE